MTNNNTIKTTIVGNGSEASVCKEVNFYNVYQLIAKITAMMSKSGISKDHKNQQQGYKFRGIDDVYNTLGSMLGEVGLVIIPRVLNREVVERQTKQGGTLFYTVVDVEYDIISSHDGSKHTAKVLGEAMDSGDKSTNKAMSAAYKYLCLQTFCIPTEGDNDADATTHVVEPKKDTNRVANYPGVKEDMKDLGYDAEKVYETIINELETVTDTETLGIWANRNKETRRVNGLPDDLKEDVKNRYNTLKLYFHNKGI